MGSGIFCYLCARGFDSLIIFYLTIDLACLMSKHHLTMAAGYTDQLFYVHLFFFNVFINLEMAAVWSRVFGNITIFIVQDMISMFLWKKSYHQRECKFWWQQNFNISKCCFRTLDIVYLYVILLESEKRLLKFLGQIMGPEGLDNLILTVHIQGKQYRRKLEIN